MLKKLTVKESNTDDIKIVAEWHKNKEVKKWIFIDDWDEYFKVVSSNKDYYLYSIFESKKLVSFICAEKIENKMYISIIVNPVLFKKGYGKTSLHLILDYIEATFLDIVSVVACIYPKNKASKKCFESVDFEFVKNGEDGEMIYEYNF